MSHKAIEVVIRELCDGLHASVHWKYCKHPLGTVRLEDDLPDDLPIFIGTRLLSSDDATREVTLGDVRSFARARHAAPQTFIPISCPHDHSNKQFLIGMLVGWGIALVTAAISVLAHR